MTIEAITSPEFLKSLTTKEMEQLSDEIRNFILSNVSKTGGHLSSNLGVVELTIALHYVFQSPHDKIIFDVGHQCYTHKILTGRANQFSKLRQRDGLAGFIKYNESIHDVWEAGHSSTALSAASGFLEAKTAGESMGEVIAVVGDGSVQNGLSFEALNYIGSHKKQKAIIIINDNDMSISANVGRLAKSFSKIRIRRSYSVLKKMTPRFIQVILKKFKNAMRGFVYDTNLFSSLGYKYYGPIDGHNVKELIGFLNFAKRSKTSVVLHVKTIKGKGYSPSEQDNVGAWHGVGPFDIKNGLSTQTKDNSLVSWGEGVCNVLCELAQTNKKLRVITPAMIGGSNLTLFQERYPDMLIDVGIAEEHAVLMAAAMSRNNVVPFVSIYSTFLQRAYDQISHDVCRNNNHVVFLIDRAGLNGGDGSTHQGIFDVSFLSHLPNMVIAMPKNLNEARALIKFSMHHEGPIAIRYPRGNTKLQEINQVDVKLGKWIVENDLKDTNIITYGDQVNAFAEALNGKSVGLISALFIKPLDLECLKQLKGTRLLVVEEVIQNGSLGSMILLANHHYNLGINIESYAVRDVYLDSGTSEQFRKDLGLDVESILEKL